MRSASRPGAPPASTLQRDLRRHRRRRWLAWAAGTAATVLVGGYLYSVWLVGSPGYSRIPAEGWATLSPGKIAVARRLLEIHDQTRSLSTDSVVRTLDPAPPPSTGLESAAEKWVVAVNQMSPGAILWARPDAQGNVLLVFGAWYGELRADDQVVALNSFGVAWRKWLQEVAGPWDSSEGFAPGIVVIDNLSDRRGPVATNLNGEIKVFRQPTY